MTTKQIDPVVLEAQLSRLIQQTVDVGVARVLMDFREAIVLASGLIGITKIFQDDDGRFGVLRIADNCMWSVVKAAGLFAKQEDALFAARSCGGLVSEFEAHPPAVK